MVPRGLASILTLCFPPQLSRASPTAHPEHPDPGMRGRGRQPRRGAGNLDTYLPLRRYTINERGGGPAPGKVQGLGGRPGGPATDRGRWARGRRSRPGGIRRRGAAGLPCRDFDLLGWAKPSAVGAQDHVWFCGFFFQRARGSHRRMVGFFFFFLSPLN